MQEWYKDVLSNYLSERVQFGRGALEGVLSL